MQLCSVESLADTQTCMYSTYLSWLHAHMLYTTQPESKQKDMESRRLNVTYWSESEGFSPQLDAEHVEVQSIKADGSDAWT